MRLTLVLSILVARGTALSVVPRVSVDHYLCDVPTPALLVDIDALRTTPEALSTASASELAAALEGVAYVHARVRSTFPRETRYHRDATYPLAALDVALPPGGAYLAMGLNNHWDADYYWARSMGPGARLAAPGIGLRCSADGLLADVVRLPEAEAAKLNPEAGFQTNDGKRSEWCEYLKAGDEVDLVPFDALATLRAFGGAVVGIQRSGRPLGAEPVTCGAWTWTPTEP